MQKKLSIKKLFVLLTALLLPLFAFEMIADEDNKAEMKIPLELSPGTRNLFTPSCNIRGVICIL